LTGTIEKSNTISLCPQIFPTRSNQPSGKTFLALFQGANRGAVIVLDLRVVKVNHSFYQTFDVKQDETEGMLIYLLATGKWIFPDFEN